MYVFAHSAHLCFYVCYVNNASKLLLTPHHGATFVAAAAAISDRPDISSFHDISSFRYTPLCIGLLCTVFRKAINQCSVFQFLMIFGSNLHQSSCMIVESNSSPIKCV